MSIRYVPVSRSWVDGGFCCKAAGQPHRNLWRSDAHSPNVTIKSLRPGNEQPRPFIAYLLQSPTRGTLGLVARSHRLLSLMFAIARTELARSPRGCLTPQPCMSTASRRPASEG